MQYLSPSILKNGVEVGVDVEKVLRECGPYIDHQAGETGETHCRKKIFMMCRCSSAPFRNIMQKKGPLTFTSGLRDRVKVKLFSMDTWYTTVGDA